MSRLAWRNGWVIEDDHSSSDAWAVADLLADEQAAIERVAARPYRDDNERRTTQWDEMRLEDEYRRA